jgi:hypothetical protein
LRLPFRFPTLRLPLRLFFVWEAPAVQEQRYLPVITMTTHLLLFVASALALAAFLSEGHALLLSTALNLVGFHLCMRAALSTVFLAASLSTNLSAFTP